VQERDQTAGKLPLPSGMHGKKRNTKQVWQPVPVTVVGEGSSESAGKRQRTNSVFDRLEDAVVGPARQGHREQ
jgi:hypothetical protein